MILTSLFFPLLWLAVRDLLTTTWWKRSSHELLIFWLTTISKKSYMKYPETQRSILALYLRPLPRSFTLHRTNIIFIVYTWTNGFQASSNKDLFFYIRFCPFKYFSQTEQKVMTIIHSYHDFQIKSFRLTIVYIPKLLSGIFRSRIIWWHILLKDCVRFWLTFIWLHFD